MIWDRRQESGILHPALAQADARGCPGAIASIAAARREVFPLGMYAAGTEEMIKAMGFPFIGVLPPFPSA